MTNRTQSAFSWFRSETIKLYGTYLQLPPTPHPTPPHPHPTPPPHPHPHPTPTPDTHTHTPYAPIHILRCILISEKKCILIRISLKHYNDVIMTAMASQITSLASVYSTVYSSVDQRKHQSSASLTFVWGISPVTGEFPAQRASNAENVSIWWCHHGLLLSVQLKLHQHWFR